MVGSVVEGSLKVYHRIPRQHSLYLGLYKPLLHCRDILLRYRSTMDLILKYKLLRGWLKFNIYISILPRSSRLLLVLPLYLYYLLYGLPVADLWFRHHTVYPKLIFKLMDYHLKVLLSLTTYKKLLSFVVSLHHKGRILLCKLLKARTYLLIIGLVLRLHCQI